MESTLIREVQREEIALIIKKAVQDEISTLKEHFQPVKPNEYLTRAELCSMLDIDQSTCHLWCKKGRLNPYGIGNRVYFKRDEVEAAIRPLNKNQKEG